MGDKIAAAGLGTGVALFGLTLPELGEVVRIVAGLCAGIASIACAYYYFRKARSK